MSAAAKTKNYDVVPTDVRRMTKFHTPGKDIKFTSLMKLIYSYIWTFQENENRGNDDPIHTNTNVIAWEMGVSEKAVIDALKALDAAKVVIKHTVKVRGNVNSSNYVAIPPASVVALGVTPPKPSNGKAERKKIEEKQRSGKSDEEEKQAEPTNPPAATPADQNPDLAVVSAPSIAGQRDSVASNDDNDNSSDDRTAGNNAVKQQEQEQQEYDDDPPFPFPPKKPESNDAPEGFAPPGELADGEQVEGEPLGHDEICEKAGAG